jgi:hypothetical protein
MQQFGPQKEKQGDHSEPLAWLREQHQNLSLRTRAGDCGANCIGSAECQEGGGGVCRQDMPNATSGYIKGEIL